MTFFQKSIVGLTWFHGIPTYDLPMAGLCSPPPWMNSYRRAGKLETVFCALSRFGQVKTPFDSPVARSRDRKSTRLNSSHVAISFAGFCLKKKKASSLLH